MSVTILPSDPALQYMGRIDRRDANAPAFYYAGSYVRLAFQGTSCSVKIRNHFIYNEMRLGYLLDGIEGVLAFPQESGEFVLTLPVSETKDNRHTLTLFKRLDASHMFRLLGFTLNDGAVLCPLPPLPTRKIECFGDSVTAGAVCEAYDAVGQVDPPEFYDGHGDNAWNSFTMQTARLLQAQIHNNGQGGIALLDHTGYFWGGELGLESTYDKLCYFPGTDTGVTSWDFSQYIPHLVILAVGQNDHHIGTQDNVPCTGEARIRWKACYHELLRTLSGHYPSATFVLTLTVLQHDPDWEQLLDEIQAETNVPNVLRFRFRRTGTATPGHPRIPEHAEMASELTQFILSLGDTIWQ